MDSFISGHFSMCNFSMEWIIRKFIKTIADCYIKNIK